MTQQKNNIRKRQKQKLRHQQRVEQWQDDQLYYEASLDPQTMEGQANINASYLKNSSPKKNIKDFFKTYCNIFKAKLY